jgi:hypothetical protein
VSLVALQVDFSTFTPKILPRIPNLGLAKANLLRQDVDVELSGINWSAGE